MFQAKDKCTHKVHQRTVCFQYVVEIDFWFVSFYFIVYLIVVHSPWVYHQIFFSFSFLFLFLLPLERPPIGFGGGRRLCGIIMESSWENCPWKGLSEKKKERKKEKFGLVSDPSRKHSSGHSCCLVGSPISAPIHSLARQAGTLGLERCFSCFFFLFFVAVPRFVFNIDPQ